MKIQSLFSSQPRFPLLLYKGALLQTNPQEVEHLEKSIANVPLPSYKRSCFWT